MSTFIVCPPKNIDNIVCTLNKYWAPLLLVQIKNIEVLAVSLNNKDWLLSLFFPVTKIGYHRCFSQLRIVCCVCVPISDTQNAKCVGLYTCCKICRALQACTVYTPRQNSLSSLSPSPLQTDGTPPHTSNGLSADMKFVKKFTQPDFQAKSFTPQKCVICDIFLMN